MRKQIDALKLALEALMQELELWKEKAQPKEPEQEPVAWAENNGEGNVLWDKESCFSDDPDWLDNPMPLYTTPPQRKPLTDERLDDIYYCVEGGATALETWRQQARAIEAAHGIKGNT